MNLTIVAGARPNFVKIAPIIHAIHQKNLLQHSISYRLVHTGQHYDYVMSHSFFKQLNIPDPHIDLECGGGSQAVQTAAIMIKFENELLSNKPDLVLVVGDVTSTMACTITAKKLNIDVVHVEAGIRSGDMNMPEEINRIITDSICNHFFTTTPWASKNLLSANIPADRIHMVGNTMIDTLYQQIPNVICPEFFNFFNLHTNEFYILTLHRPSNVDDLENLQKILQAIKQSASNHKVVFPVHPRTKLVLKNITLDFINLIIVEPQPYLEFLFLLKNCKGIITDSGGITEEATVLNIPCLTLRNSTERPETIELGSNELIGDDLNKLQYSMNLINNKMWKSSTIPAFWDGKTSERIIEILCNHYN